MTVATFPCAMATSAQSSSLTGMAPLWSQAWSGKQTPAAPMNSQTARDKTPAAG